MLRELKHALGACRLLCTARLLLRLLHGDVLEYRVAVCGVVIGVLTVHVVDKDGE